MSKKWIFAALTATLLTACSMQAQELPPPPHHGGFGPGGPMGERMQILGFEEMHAGKVVTGAPYSAVRVSETTQTLADGTTINRKIQTNVFRDSQGRLRREVTLPAIGPLATSGQTKTFVVIHDPVAGTSYELRPEQKSAVQLGPRPGGGHRNADELQGRFEAHLQAEIANGTVKKEDLGTQTVNGLVAQGTRYTRTFAAGQIGNDKPFNVTDEVWYSADLQIVVKSVRSDPRFGSITYNVTNIQRQEQPSSLFTLPAGYSVTQGRGHGKGAMPPPPPDAPPAE